MGTLGSVTTPSGPSGGGTADLVAELRAQAQAAVARAADTKEQVTREVVEVRQQAEAVADALEAGARQAAETMAADGQRSDDVVISQARATAAAAIAESEAQAASIRVTAAASADEASAALARAEVRHESAAVQADALRLTARREASLHRRQQLEETDHLAHEQLDGVSDTISRLGVTLEDLARALADLPPTTTRLRAGITAVEPAGAPVQEPAADPAPAKDEAAGPAGRNLFDPPGSMSERLRRVRNR